MKRLLRATFAIGALAAALVFGVQKTGALSWAEALFPSGAPNNEIGAGNYLLVLLLSCGVTWMMLAVRQTSRRILLLGVLLAELLGARWVLGMAGKTFQPIPAILGTLIAAAAAAVFRATSAARDRRTAAGLFDGRLSEAAIDRLLQRGMTEFLQPTAREVSFVFCEIANQAELIEQQPPAISTRLTREFINCATKVFLQENGYILAADGEGIRVLFGFPETAANHAAAAAQAALAFCERCAAEAGGKADSLGRIDLRIGISSGEVLATPRADAWGQELVIAGEPLELARRLARANHIYGSRVLLAPRTFTAARDEIVARPIDFLRNGGDHDRLEVYELLALTARASAEELARRDRFWTGIVYFREKRWNEAFAEFSRARGNNGELDEPLQWYLRRLEPLLLRIATEPPPVVEPLSPL